MVDEEMSPVRKKYLREPASGFTHLAGALLAISGLVLLIVYSALYATAWHVVSMTVFGVCLILLYTASTLYHLLPLSPKGVAFFRKLDHMMIFVLIAGTYTPICLVPLRGAFGWTLFGLIWFLAASGIFLKAFWIGAPRWLSTVFYILMGWLVVVAFLPLWRELPHAALAWMVAGGLFYTFGAVIYALKIPKGKFLGFGFHEIWHIFVLLGSFSHFWLMFRYVIYL